MDNPKNNSNPCYLAAFTIADDEDATKHRACIRGTVPATAGSILWIGKTAHDSKGAALAEAADIGNRIERHLAGKEQA